LSILAKDCPDCGETNPAYAVRCRCGYEFNETVDQGEEDDDLALTVQEEELYLEYLNARAQQAAADARHAVQAAGEQPNNKVAAAQAERAQAAAKTAAAEFESQQARVATAVKALKGNNSASPLADSGSARQTSAPAKPEALPSTAAPPRTSPKPTVSPAATAKSERPASVTSPVNSSTPVNKASDVHAGTRAASSPATQTASAESRKASPTAATPTPTALEKAPVPNRPAAVPPARMVAETTSSVGRDHNATAKATPEPSAIPSADSKSAEHKQGAAPTPTASATDSSVARGKPTDVPKIEPENGGKRDDTSEKPTSTVLNATPKTGAADAPVSNKTPQAPRHWPQPPAPSNWPKN
jgi:hypothetical protein